MSSGNFADMFGGIIGGISGMANDSADRERLAKLPDVAGFSDQPYDRVNYAGDFKPQQYGAPEAAAYQTITEDPRTRDYQMQALSRMQQLADQSAGSQEALGRYNAVSDANSVAAQQNAGIRNQMAMRGQGGSGMEFVLQQQAAQNAANRAQAAGLNAAQQAALQRLQGTQGVMAGASNVRGMDANVAGQNADIINRFNMYNTGMRNQTNNANVDMGNAAGMRNLNTQQGLMGTNAGINNQSLDRNDRNKLTNLNTTRQKFGQQREITGSLVNNVTNFGRGIGSAADATADMMSGGMG
jgi:hypothetical protein